MTLDEQLDVGPYGIAYSGYYIDGQIFLVTRKHTIGIAKRIEGAKLVVVPCAGHMSPLENPTAVNQAIREFLRR